MDIGPGEWIVICLVVLLVFGSHKIPELARSLGRAQQEFKQGLSEGRANTGDDPTLDTEASSSDGDPAGA